MAWAMCDFPTPVGPSSSAFWRRVMKTQVAKSSTLAFGIRGLKTKSKSSSVLLCSKLAFADPLLELLSVTPLDLVRE